MVSFSMNQIYMGLLREDKKTVLNLFCALEFIL